MAVSHKAVFSVLALLAAAACCASTHAEVLTGPHHHGGRKLLLTPPSDNSQQNGKTPQSGSTGTRQQNGETPPSERSTDKPQQSGNAPGGNAPWWHSGSTDKNSNTPQSGSNDKKPQQTGNASGQSGSNDLTTGSGCNIGPSFWCKSKDNFNECKLQDYKSVGVCGYASSPAGCNTTSLADFCDKNSNALAFNGGINGSPTGYFGYFAFAMTWVPSSCNSTTPLRGFCTTFTNGSTYSANHLVLHGLWPDYGSVYSPPGPQPPFYNGTQKSYQGWPQWCDGDGISAGQCAVGPNNACPWANKTSINQDELERCFRANQVSQCLVPDSDTDALGSQFQQIAPGYLSPDGKPSTFMDHEFFKHGSCIGGELTRNKTAYFQAAVNMAWQRNAPGTPADNLITKNVGGKVLLSDLDKAFNQQAIPTCKKASCNLDEVWYCMGRDQAGLPTGLITCPVGTLASNSCLNQGCEYVNIPAWK